MKFLGRDADDGKGMAVHFNFLPKDTLVTGESFLPVGISENEDRIGARSLPFCRENQTAEGGLEAEGRKIVTRNARGDAVVAAIVGGEPTERDAVSDQVTDGSRLIAEIEVVRIRELLQVFVAVLLQGQDGDLLGMWYGHRAEEEAVDDAEDRRVDGNTQGESEDGEGREPRGFAESAKSETEILPETGHRVTSQDYPLQCSCKSASPPWNFGKLLKSCWLQGLGEESQSGGTARFREKFVAKADGSIVFKPDGMAVESPGIRGGCPRDLPCESGATRGWRCRP